MPRQPPAREGPGSRAEGPQQQQQQGSCRLAGEGRGAGGWSPAKRWHHGAAAWGRVQVSPCVQRRGRRWLHGAMDSEQQTSNSKGELLLVASSGPPVDSPAEPPPQHPPLVMKFLHLRVSLRSHPGPCPSPQGTQLPDRTSAYRKDLLATSILYLGSEFRKGDLAAFLSHSAELGSANQEARFQGPASSPAAGQRTKVTQC